MDVAGAALSAGYQTEPSVVFSGLTKPATAGMSQWLQQPGCTRRCCAEHVRCRNPTIIGGPRRARWARSRTGGAGMSDQSPRHPAEPRARLGRYFLRRFPIPNEARLQSDTRPGSSGIAVVDAWNKLIGRATRNKRRKKGQKLTHFAGWRVFNVSFAGRFANQALFPTCQATLSVAPPPLDRRPISRRDDIPAARLLSRSSPTPSATFAAAPSDGVAGELLLDHQLPTFVEGEEAQWIARHVSRAWTRHH